MTSLLHCLALIALTAACARANDADFSVMTYNIRLDIASDGPNRWDNRKAQLAAQIAYQRPEALGVQEALAHQVAYLDEALSEYAYLGVARDDGKQAGEFSAVFYRTDALRPLESSTFWLSETPDQPSFGWGASYRRICTYARFERKATGKTLWIFNTHMDHETPEARLNGAKLILQRIQALADDEEPVFLIGDLNATPEAAPIQLIAETMGDARVACEGPVFGPEGTFNGFRPDRLPERRIDYVFTSPRNVAVSGYATFSDLVDLRYLSDHFPVMIRCALNPPQPKAR